MNGLYNDQEKRITELAERLHETKVALAGAANERDHLKEKVQMVEKNLEKTNNKLYEQKERFERELEDARRRLADKLALLNSIKERADRVQKEHTALKVDHAGIVDKLSNQIKDHENELKQARANLKEQHSIIEQMHAESVVKDQQILEGNAKLIAQITKVRQEHEEEKRAEEMRVRQATHRHRE